MERLVCIVLNDKKMMCSCIFATALVLSNVLSSKIVEIGPLSFTAGIICYSITYLMTDVLGELYGEETANRTVEIGLVCQFLALILISIAIVMPTTNEQIQGQFEGILGSNKWFMLASLISYMLSQMIDVYIFHRLRNYFISKNKYKRWIWNNTATIISQLVDTAVFLIIAIGIGQQFLCQEETTKVLFKMIGSQYLVKVLLAIVDTPIFYLLTRKKETEIWKF